MERPHTQHAPANNTSIFVHKNPNGKKETKQKMNGMDFVDVYHTYIIFMGCVECIDYRHIFEFIRDTFCAAGIFEMRSLFA